MTVCFESIRACYIAYVLRYVRVKGLRRLQVFRTLNTIERVRNRQLCIMKRYERRCRWRRTHLNEHRHAFEGAGTKAILHVMFIAQQAGDVHGRIAVSTTAGGLGQISEACDALVFL